MADQSDGEDAKGRSAKASAKAPERAKDGSAKVVYSLDTILNNGDTVLIAGFGTPLRTAVRACYLGGAKDRIWVTGSEDKKRGFSFAGEAKVAVLGQTFSKELFRNERAILNAVRESGAKIVLLTDPDLIGNELLKAMLEDAGTTFYGMYTDDHLGHLWEKCRANPDMVAALGTFTWRKCSSCGLEHPMNLVMELDGQCPSCGNLYRLRPMERIEITCDPGSFVEWDTDIEQVNPLDFPGYEGKLDRAAEVSGYSEAVVCGLATIGRRPTVICVMESEFLMVSLGHVVWEKITRAIERATSAKLPVILFCASGCARMQEGLGSLMQMAKVSAAVERHGRAGLLYVSVLTDPTTGGVTASFATEGDIILAEPGALIGFAGRRVIQDTIKQALPDDFQTAEFALEHGLIDKVVPRERMRLCLSRILAIHYASSENRDDITIKYGSPLEVMSDGTESMVVPAGISIGGHWHEDIHPSRSESDDLGAFADIPGLRILFKWGKASKKKALERAVSRRGLADYPDAYPQSGNPDEDDKNEAWASVQLARNVHRPTGWAYLEGILDDFVELHGDRAFGDDGAIVGGIGLMDGHPVTVIAEEKGENLDERIKRNFGCPMPEGYRKALRLMKQAEKFNRPVICIVDTQGAFCGTDAEARGQGNAIADLLVTMAGLTVPIVSVIVGEGGSGGALALAAANKVAMQEHAIYSILSPERFDSILWKDRSKAAEAASVMKLTAEESKELGIVEEVLSEGKKPAHENPDAAVAEVKKFIKSSLAELSEYTSEELLAQRYERFREY
ncbi:MAG: acetyl-CoA carboxylase carboxyltransferase subunit alpha [Eggerthellaceae bacterium]|nr:acetyl-CoA carboxylase carboxyltransferase subunit alpha [Eggerthellaceae bacterium]